MNTHSQPMTPNPTLHDLCLIANGLLQARASVYAAQPVLGPFAIDPETIANDALGIYQALAAKAKPKSYSTTDAL